MADLIPIAPDAAEFEVALEEWKRLASQAAYARSAADDCYAHAYLDCPPNGEGKSAPEHQRKVYADKIALHARYNADVDAVAAQAARFRVEFLVKRAGRS